MGFGFPSDVSSRHKFPQEQDPLISLSNPTLELDLQSKATADYFKGFHDLIKQYNDDLTSSWQNATIIQSLL